MAVSWTSTYLKAPCDQNPAPSSLWLLRLRSVSGGEKDTVPTLHKMRVCSLRKSICVQPARLLNVSISQVFITMDHLYNIFLGSVLCYFEDSLSTFKHYPRSSVLYITVGRSRKARSEGTWNPCLWQVTQCGGWPKWWWHLTQLQEPRLEGWQKEGFE